MTSNRSISLVVIYPFILEFGMGLYLFPFVNSEASCELENHHSNKEGRFRCRLVFLSLGRQHGESAPGFILHDLEIYYCVFEYSEIEKIFLCFAWIRVGLSIHVARAIQG